MVVLVPVMMVEVGVYLHCSSAHGCNSGDNIKIPESSDAIVMNKRLDHSHPYTTTANDMEEESSGWR